MGGIETERDLSLDSTFFVAFDLTHRALKSGLAQASRASTSPASERCSTSNRTW